MTFKTAIIVLVASAFPAVSFAMGCSGEHRTQQTASCATGFVWDTEKSLCVPLVSS